LKESGHDGQLVEFVDKVDPELVREKKGEDTMSGRGLLNSREAPQCLPQAVAANSEPPSEAKRLTMRAPLNVQALISSLAKRGRCSQVVSLWQSVERAMAVTILMGNCKGSCIYSTREDLVYWHAVYDGMAPEDSDGKENDPHEYFRKLDYEYLGSEHLKGVSSKRSELAGMKGVRLVFRTCTKFNWKGAWTKEQLKEQKALKEKPMSKC
jgi:hypothetical protein